MSRNNDGGPAFPRAEGPNSAQRDGMSLRDWFAGIALQGILAEDAGNYSFAGAAEAAYETADAMLAERAKVRP